MSKKLSFGRLIATLLPFILLLNSCSALFQAPTEKQNSTLGQTTPYTKELRNLPSAKEKIVVAVYKFRDQTGQYKMSETGANWSTAIPQGTTSILIKALEDTDWFTVIERENISNLLNERQIIRTTRQEYQDPNGKATAGGLPPLLYAGILLEGGIISYDTNLLTGGMGARYFGIGGSTQYRQDNITVYLRVVSTSNGKVLKTIYTSKSILSQAMSGNFFRYIDTEKLLEAEVGVTKNEPVQLAVKEAIEKAVYSLVLEGIRDKIWDIQPNEVSKTAALLDNYAAEENINTNLQIDNRIQEPRRGAVGTEFAVIANQIKGDYKEAVFKPGGRLSISYAVGDHFNLKGSFSASEIENTGIFKTKLATVDLNAEYIILPYDRFSPYLYGGGGIFGYGENLFDQIMPKAQLGGGVEYLYKNNLGIRLSAEYQFGFKDDLDGMVSGTQKDNILTFGLGLSYYFGRKNNRNFSN